MKSFSLQNTEMAIHSEEVDLKNTEKALLNILDDYSEEKNRAEDNQRALLNILDDYSLEKASMENMQRAVLNILEDYSSEKVNMEDTQRAVLNILEDYGEEKGKVSKINEGLKNEIIERKKTEETLKQSEIRFRELFESAPEGLVVVDSTTFKIVKFNANAIKLFQYSAEEFIKIGAIGTRPLFQPDGRSSEEKIKEIRMTLMKGAKPVFEWLIVDANGKEILCEVRLTLLSNSNGSQHLASFIDITERKNAEKKIEEQNKELALSNIELEQFAYVASHDLQEPLRMVSSFLNLLEKRMEGQLDDTNKQYLNFAVDGAKRMKNLILALLEYSRVGVNKEDFAPVDLNEVVQYVINVLEENIKKNTALITFKLLPVITANQTLITHLFLNLVQNALKYHNGNQTEIEIGSTEDKDWYFIYVKDNGIGIDPKFFDKVFVIFQRLHAKNEYSGTGIGLAICKKIVEIHKGKIWVESEAGKGSTFYFSLPKTKHSA